VLWRFSSVLPRRRHLVCWPELLGPYGGWGGDCFCRGKGDPVPAPPPRIILIRPRAPRRRGPGPGGWEEVVSRGERRRRRREARPPRRQVPTDLVGKCSTVCLPVTLLPCANKKQGASAAVRWGTAPTCVPWSRLVAVPYCQSVSLSGGGLGRS
jgi:hypothetical protein